MPEQVKRGGKWVKVETEAEKEKRLAKEEQHRQVMQAWRAEVEQQVKAANAEYKEAVRALSAQRDLGPGVWSTEVHRLAKELHHRTLVIYGYEPKGLLGRQHIEDTEAMRIVRERRAEEAVV